MSQKYDDILMGDMGDRYLDQYFGPWAIEDIAANGLLAKASTIRLQEHRVAFIAAKDAADIEQSADEGGDRVASGPYRGQLTQDGVAIVHVRGTLMKFNSSLSSSSGTVALRREIRQAVADDRVRGIMLKVESPGGTVSGTAELADDVKAAGEQKPLWAYADDLMASAAYWVSASAARIGANRTAMVGSLGTVAVLYDWSKKFESEGVEALVFSTGKYKGTGAMGAKVTEEQRDYYQALIDETNTHFKAAVEDGRGKKSGKLFDGRVHVAGSALDLGLIDAVVSFDDFYSQFVASLPDSGRTGAAAEHQPAAVGDPAQADETVVGNSAASSSDAGKGVDMATQETTGTNTTAAVATASMIREACPGATGDFVLSQLEQNATLESAMKAHIASQASVIAARESTIAERDASLSTMEAKVGELEAKIEEGQKASVNQPAEQNAAGEKETPKADGTTPEARAEAEWNASADIQSRYPKKKYYVGFRTAQMAGMVKGVK